MISNSIDRYEDIETQKEIVQVLGQKTIDSGKFKNLVSQQVVCQLNYTPDDFLLLLSTYTPYLKLDSKARTGLFRELRQKIADDHRENIQITYISACQVMAKC